MSNIKLKMPICVISEANTREHWTKRAKRRVAQQKEFSALWRKRAPSIVLPCKIIFTRYASRLLDSDNLAGAFKFVRDQFAREVGIDDGSAYFEFEYRQEKLPKRECYISIEIL